MEQRASKESLAELWSDFLEREAGTGTGNSDGSRRASEAGVLPPGSPGSPAVTMG
jgi:hypothetical protein